MWNIFLKKNSWAGFAYEAKEKEKICLRLLQLPSEARHYGPSMETAKLRKNLSLLYSELHRKNKWHFYYIFLSNAYIQALHVTLLFFHLFDFFKDTIKTNLQGFRSYIEFRKVLFLYKR